MRRSAGDTQPDAGTAPRVWRAMRRRTVAMGVVRRQYAETACGVTPQRRASHADRPRSSATHFCNFNREVLMGSDSTSTPPSVVKHALGGTRVTPTCMESGTQSLSAEEAEIVRQKIAALQTKRGDQATLARALGVTPQALSKIALRRSDPGVKIARALADHLGVTFDELLGHAEPEPRLSSLAGWDAAEQAARERHPWVPTWAWEAVRNLRTTHPPKVLTADWIARLAQDWASALGADGR